MAKFCGKCGTRLDETTGLCPNCDADKLKRESGLGGSEDMLRQMRTEDRELQGRTGGKENNLRHHRKNNKKRKKKFKICIAIVILLLIVGSGVAGALVYFGKSNSEMTEQFENSENSTEVDRTIPETNTEGFSYYKSSAQNIVKDDETEAIFVNNEILVILVSENYKTQLQEYLDTIGGSIVGELPEVAEYQILLEESHSYSELKQMMDDIQKYEWISSVSLNYAAPIDTSYIPNDKKWKNKWEDVADGTNWGMEAIDAPAAWDYLDQLGEVRIGVCDDMFEVQHEDLQFAENPFENDSAIEAVSNGDIQWSSHGTHVSGTIAAVFDNKKGITGVVPKVKLYGVSSTGMVVTGWDTLQRWRVMFHYLIVKKQCSVVNISLSYDEISFGASRGDKTETEALNEMSEEIGKYLKRLIDEGYSFVVCGSAGNQNKAGNKKYTYFRKDADDPYELTYYCYQDYLDYLKGDKAKKELFERYKGRKKEIESRLESGNVDAKYGILGAIADPDVKKRIIIVGAAQNLGTHKEGGFLGIGAEKKHDGYEIADFSQCGERVDVIAPGVDIYSTVKNGYASMGGTSQAAPHVAGIAGLIFSANSNVRADHVKKLITESAVGNYGEEGYGMVNAKRAVDLAYNYTSATYDDEVLVVPITPTDDTEIWNTFLQEKQYEPNITDWTITELQYCLLDIDQDGRKELILTPGTAWDDFEIYQVYTIGEDEKVYLADDFTACYGISYSSKYKALAYNSSRPSEMSASLEYYAMDGTKMTESFAVNMEVDLNTYLPVYNVHNTSKGTDTTITEDEYEAYQKECTPLTEWKTLESKSAKKNSGKTQTSDQEWKTAYAQFLRNGEYKSDMPGCDAPRFFVYDVDGDGSMELVIIRATYSVVGGDVYALVNGKVVHAGGTSGTYGSFASYPSDGLILSSYGHMGVDLEEYFTLSDGKLVSQARWISSFTDGETWYLNDQETTQEAYETWKAEHVNGEIFAVEYQDAHPITEENIQAYVK